MNRILNICARDNIFWLFHQQVPSTENIIYNQDFYPESDICSKMSHVHSTSPNNMAGKVLTFTWISRSVSLHYAVKYKLDLHTTLAWNLPHRRPYVAYSSIESDHIWHHDKKKSHNKLKKNKGQENLRDKTQCYHQLEVFKAHFCHNRLAHCLYKKQWYWYVMAINEHEDGGGLGISLENVCTLSPTLLLEITSNLNSWSLTF